MALGGVYLFLLTSALSLWDEVFLDFFFSFWFYCFFRLDFVCLAIKHRAQNMVDSKLTCRMCY